MSLHTYRYGESRHCAGLCLGVARHLPRGVRRSDYSALGYFDVWLPVVSPSPELVAAYRDKSISFNDFARKYKAEMKRPEPRQVIRLLAATARVAPINIGCYCEREELCHRSILKQLIEDADADLPLFETAPPKFSSPACSMPEIED